MTTRFVCLANSFKEGGRCIAGIELDLNNDAIFLNGKPKWIRPVYDTGHGQIPNHIAEPFHILDIVELDIIAPKPEGYQSENVIFAYNSLSTIGNFSRDKLNDLCENQNIIFGNRRKAVHHDSIDNLNYSLMLVSTSQFDITNIVYMDKTKCRLIFDYHNVRYDLPITDPSFLNKYQSNNKLLENINQVYLTLSLGVALNDWYYKLVAGIIY